MIKKIFAISLALTMACTSALAAFAEDTADYSGGYGISASDLSDENIGKTYGDYKYEVLDNSTVEIMKYIGNDSKVSVPSRINGMRVSSIGVESFGGCSGIESITLPNTVTVIGDYAFHDCSSLKSITIPGSVTKISNWAFKNCSSLKSVKIPSSVTSLGYNVFFGTPLFNNQKSSVKYAGKWVISCSEKAASAKIKSTAVGIADYAFCLCEGLKSITIPKSVKYVGDYAFISCTSLKSVTIPGSVKSIGEGAFYRCTSLKSVYVPKSVESIGDKAFGYMRDSNHHIAKAQSFTLKCCSGSAALSYAKENKLDYLIADKKPDTPTVTKSSKCKKSVRLYFKRLDGISGYKIQQYDSKTKKWKTVGKSTVSYKDGTGYNYKITGLKSGTKYKFRVQAYTSLKSKTLKSGWSKTYSVRTK